ncbi:TonB-dependent receptor [Persicobacter psychrovividus]|uniref:SusC/RagA family TonB-linked outer membrane protein n=1 Tax=Persicobacter psychrovividus TaxID=387638 RepID=A0ABM7VI68_9BACT|nr:SusC/RagA family TonB-linked outer membrane protein [Persicobacter psychrovividus]
MMRKLLSIALALLLPLQLLAQAQISGTVTDAETGEEVIGANVVIKGTSTGTITDLMGDFSLQASTTDVLVISYIGYAPQEVLVGGQVKIDIRLGADAKELEEVMVVAYGEQKKSSFTGSAATVKKDHIEKLQVSNVQNALEGAVPGVQVSGTSGQPGSGSTIRIRGIGSVNASSAPLYVVDGVPFTGDLNNLNPDDIASMTVLKDASATALYGSRAANGVVMVTTQKGKSGEGQIHLKARVGVAQRAMSDYDRVGAAEYMEMQWTGYRNNLYHNSDEFTMEDAGLIASGQHPIYSRPGYIHGIPNVVDMQGGYNAFNVSARNLIDPASGKINPEASMVYQPDWEDALYQAALRQEYSVSMSGAGDQSDYFLSMGYLNEDGVVRNTGFERFTARLNTNADIKPWLKAGLNMSFVHTETTNTMEGGTYTSNPFFFSQTIAPIYPIYQWDFDQGSYVTNDAGQRIYDYGDQRPHLTLGNALGTLNLDPSGYKHNAVSARTYLDATISDHWSFRMNTTMDYYNRVTLNHQNRNYGDAANVGGRTSRATQENVNMTANQLFSYRNQFGKHSVNALFGHESYFSITNGISATVTGFAWDGMPEMGSGANATAASSYIDRHAIESFLSRFEYNYDERFFGSVSYRVDGSSRFHPDNRWGHFWSVGGSWSIDKESFIQDQQWISSLKLRASFGEQGNENIGNYYAYRSLYSLNYPNNSMMGALKNYLENPHLKWEKRQALNVGLDFGLFNNKLTGSVEYFNNASRDLLFDLPLPPSTGWGGRMDNVGAMKNYGVELNLTANLINRTDFTWAVDFSATHMKNKMTSLPQEFVGTGSKRLEVGRSYYDFYLFDFAGVDPATGDALYYFEMGEDMGRGVTNDLSNADRYHVGSALASVTGFVNQRFTYKSFDFGFMLNYQIGGQVYNSNYAALMNPKYGHAMHVDQRQAWTQPGDITDVPRIETLNQNLYAGSSRWLQDASFLSVRNITFGYNLPKTWAQRMKMQNVRLSAAVDNLYTFSGMQGYFPGTASSDGYMNNSYQPIRTMSLGVDVKF